LNGGQSKTFQSDPKGRRGRGGVSCGPELNYIHPQELEFNGGVQQKKESTLYNNEAI